MTDMFSVCKLLGQSTSLNLYGNSVNQSNLPEINKTEKRKRYGKSVAAKFFNRRNKLTSNNRMTPDTNGNRGKLKTVSELKEFKNKTKSRIQRCLKKLKQKQTEQMQRENQKKDEIKQYNESIRLRNKKLYNRNKEVLEPISLHSNTDEDKTEKIPDIREQILRTIKKLKTNYRYAKNRKAKRTMKVQIKQLQAQLLTMTDPNYPTIHEPETSPEIHHPISLPVIEYVQPPLSCTLNDNKIHNPQLFNSNNESSTKITKQEDIHEKSLEEQILCFHDKLVLHRRHPTDSDFTELPVETARDEMLLPCINCGWKTICSKNWYLRVDDQCPKCLEKHYIRKVRHYRKECHSALQEREQKNIISSSQYKIESKSWF